MARYSYILSCVSLYLNIYLQSNFLDTLMNRVLPWHNFVSYNSSLVAQHSPAPLTSGRRSSNDQGTIKTQSSRPNLSSLPQPAANDISHLLTTDNTWGFDVLKLESLTEKRSAYATINVVLCDVVEKFDVFSMFFSVYGFGLRLSSSSITFIFMVYLCKDISADRKNCYFVHLFQ